MHDRADEALAVLISLHKNKEDPQNNSSSKPDWVSYFVQDPNSKQWVHTTLFSIPAGTTVHVTILGYGAVAKMLYAHADTKTHDNTYWSWIESYVGDDYDAGVKKEAGKLIKRGT